MCFIPTPHYFNNSTHHHHHQRRYRYCRNLARIFLRGSLLVRYLAYIITTISKPSFSMFHPPANLPSSWPKSTPHTAPHTGRSFPDPLNRNACARFRLRRKAPKTPFSHCRGAPPSNSDISQLWDATLDLSRRLNDLSNIVLDLATSVHDHLSRPCSLPVPVVSAAPLVSAPNLEVASPPYRVQVFPPRFMRYPPSMPLLSAAQHP